MKNKQTTKSKTLLALAMAIFGTIGPFTRQISVSSGELALYRAALAVAMIGAYIAVAKQKINFSKVKKQILLLSLSGIAIGFNWVLLFQAYKYTTISVATLSYYFAPVIVTVACPLLFKEKLTKKQAVCFVMSTVGLCMIIGVGQSSTNKTDVMGILYGLSAAVLYAAVVLMNKYIKDVNGIHRTFIQFVGASIVLLPYVYFTDGFSLASLDGNGWICLLILGLVHTGAAYCLYFTSIKSLDGQTVSILSYIDPLVAVLVSFFALGESMTPLQIAGGVLILCFTLYNEV